VSTLLLSPILIPLATALLTAMTMRQARLQQLISLIGIGAFFVSATLLLLGVLEKGSVVVTLGGWPAPFGIEFVGDLLGVGMVAITALMGACALLFQYSSETDSAEVSGALAPLVHGLLAGVSGAFLTGDIFNLYVWFELMLVTALGLLAYRGSLSQLEATFKYFVLNTMGTLLLLMGIAFLYSATGHLSFRALHLATEGGASVALFPVIAMIALAFLVKAASFPVFAWLPASYHTLPAPILVLFAGLLTKVGIYGLMRLLGEVFPLTPDVFFVFLKWVAAATMLVGVLGAAYHWHIKRILAFHSISQIGYMLLGISLDSHAGYVATLVYVLHHSVVKVNLFLVGAMVYRKCGSYDLRQCGGLYARSPGLALLFALSALSLVGVPPLSGFWAKVLVLNEAIGQEEYVLAVIALFVGLLTLYSMTKIWFEAFWKRHPDEAWAAPAVGGLAPAYVVTLALTLLTVGIGLMPEPFVHYAQMATAHFLGAK